MWPAQLQAAGTHTHICLEPGMCLYEPLPGVSQEKVFSAAGRGELLHGDGQWCSIRECSQQAGRSFIKGAMQYICEVLLLLLLHEFIKFNADIEGFHQSQPQCQCLSRFSWLSHWRYNSSECLEFLHSEIIKCTLQTTAFTHYTWIPFQLLLYLLCLFHSARIWSYVKSTNIFFP